MALRKCYLTSFCTLDDLATKVRRGVSPKKSLAFNAVKSEYLTGLQAFRTDIPRNEPLDAPDGNCYRVEHKLYLNIFFHLR